MARKITRKGLVKKLDKAVSDYVRQRDKRCVTCGSTERLGCGHIFSRVAYSTRWDLDNCHAQCLTSESSLRMVDGAYKSIESVVVGDILAGFDDRVFDIQPSKVLRVSSFTPRELYKVTLANGHSFCGTPDHRVVANGKWVEIREMLHSPTTYDILEI